MRWVAWQLLLCMLASTYARPPPADRKFVSPAVDALIAATKPRFRDPALGSLFENCLPSTLDTTVKSFTPAGNGQCPDGFVITGDIDASWPRDTTNQLLPYIPLLNASAAAPFGGQSGDPLGQLICGVMLRMAADLTHDCFANAFNFAQEGGPHQDDKRVPPMTPHVFEGKYELDTLAAFWKLSRLYAEASPSGFQTCLACPGGSTRWTGGVHRTLQCVRTQQTASEVAMQAPDAYRFQRLTYVASDTLPVQGFGYPGAYTGMSRSSFRPSDDATSLPFHVPGNAMAAVELTRLSAALETVVAGSQPLAADLLATAQQIEQGLLAFAVVDSQLNSGQPVFAYEVDGFGSASFMDDANIPSLLSLPYLGYVGDDDLVHAGLRDWDTHAHLQRVYQNTRKAVLSNRANATQEHFSNAFYFDGTAGRGIGGPHEGVGYVWPMALAVQALTSTSDSEILDMVHTLQASAVKNNWMHESFWKDDFAKFTRPWFAWANSLFGELMLWILKERPSLLFN